MSSSPPDAGTFWRTLGQRATGITVVTAMGPDGPEGFLGLSAAHVCASPPTMLVSIGRTTHALGAVLASRHFAINILPADAAPLATIFSGKAGVGGAMRFEPDAWTVLATGAPVLANALGVFDCRVDQVVERASAVIVIGEAVAAECREGGDPLLFFRGRTYDDIRF